MDRWSEAVQKVMTDNQIQNPMQLIGAILVLLREQHRLTAGLSGKAFNDRMDTFTHKHAATLAESLANFAGTMAEMHLSNAEGYAELGRPEAAAMEQQGRVTKAVHELLEYYLPIWNADSSDVHQAAERLSRRLQRGQGVEPPDGADPEANPPADPKRF